MEWSLGDEMMIIRGPRGNVRKAIHTEYYIPTHLGVGDTLGILTWFFVLVK